MRVRHGTGEGKLDGQHSEPRRPSRQRTLDLKVIYKRNADFGIKGSGRRRPLSFQLSGLNWQYNTKFSHSSQETNTIKT